MLMNWMKFDSHRELAFVDDEEQLVVREEDSVFEQRLDVSSMSVDCILHALLSSDCFPVFSIGINDSFMSEAIDDLDELLLFFTCRCKTNKS
ncbi:hypothetical protein Hanom_Chr11g00987621 [Helianthus anomalus]